MNKLNFQGVDQKQVKLSPIQKEIISMMLECPTITQERLAEFLDKSVRTIQYNIKQLTNLGMVERVGHTKGGKWIVLKYFK